jgi:hypothetical protein
LDATVSQELELDTALYAQQQLDGALSLFQTTLNDKVCLLTGAEPREASAWCQMLQNSPKDKAIKNQAVGLKKMTAEQVKKADDAAKMSKRPFLAEAKDLGLIDEATAEWLCKKIGEGCHPDLCKKWPEYKSWDYSSACSGLKTIMQGRNALNHNEPMDILRVLLVIESLLLVLRELQLHNPLLEAMYNSLDKIKQLNTLKVAVVGESEAERMRRVPFRVKEDELIGRSSDITALASSLPRYIDTA